MAPIVAARTRRADGRSPLRTPSANRATATALLSVMLLLIARLLRQRAAAANRSRRTAQWVVHCCAAPLSDSLRYCFAYTTRVLCRRPTRCCGRSRFTGRKARPGGARQPSQWHLFVASCTPCVASAAPVVFCGNGWSAAAHCVVRHCVPRHAALLIPFHPFGLIRPIRRGCCVACTAPRYSCARTAHSNGSRPKRAVS